MPPDRPHAIITGAASGLGRAIALRLARDGWEIALCDLNEAGSRETLALVRQAGGEGRVESFDVTRPEQWQALHDRLTADWQHLDLLVNNAGVAGSGEMGKYSLDDWHWIVNINLYNGIYGCHTFVDWLKRNPRGAHIINTASLAAIASAPTMAGYNVTKAGMLALSETLYAELMPHRVGVTVLCPAFFPTNLLKQGRFVDEKERKLAEKSFQQSRMSAEQVADAAIRAMHRKQLYVVMPAQGRFYWYYKRLSPARFVRSIGKMFTQQLARAQKSP